MGGFCVIRVNIMRGMCMLMSRSTTNSNIIYWNTRQIFFCLEPEVQPSSENLGINTIRKCFILFLQFENSMLWEKTYLIITV